jgi:hypothetical protein
MPADKNTLLISVVIPALNEELVIGNVVMQIHAMLRNWTRTMRLLCSMTAADPIH